MAFSQDLFDDKLRRTIRKIEKNPEKEVEYRKKYVAWTFEFIRKRVDDARHEVILALCYQLYSADFVSLRSDLAKIKMFGLARDASKEERFELLKCLADSIELYLKGDYSILLNQLGNMCTLSEDMADTEADSNLPFN